jgi:hypothetical protein
MKLELVDIARVDLGPDHNGRVARRNVYEKPDGTLVVVDKGKHIPLLCINPKPLRPTSAQIKYRSRPGVIAYVTRPRMRREGR